jgi:hypothetical protein
METPHSARKAFRLACRGMKEDKISQAGEPADAFKGQQFEVVTQALSGCIRPGYYVPKVYKNVPKLDSAPD